MIDGEPGDLRFVVRAIPSKRWERRGKDLVINETITLLDALTGVVGPQRRHALTRGAAAVV